MFNGSAGNSLNTDFVNSDNVLFGKYYKDATTAYRGSLRILNYSIKQDILIDTNTVNSNPTYLTDMSKQSGSLFQIGAGLEKRKGEGRFQGYYGGELNITLGGATNIENTYAATLDSANIADEASVNNRILTSKLAGGFGLGIRAFAGVEYFIAPKISLGAEFGWGFGLQNTGEGETVTEVYGFDGASATTQSTHTVTTMTGKNSVFAIDTDNMGARIKLLFHF